MCGHYSLVFLSKRPFAEAKSYGPGPRADNILLGGSGHDRTISGAY